MQGAGDSYEKNAKEFICNNFVKTNGINYTKMNLPHFLLAIDNSYPQLAFRAHQKL